MNLETSEEKPFSITFSHKGKSVEIIFDDGNDIFKLASIFQMTLIDAGIKFKTVRNENND